ncbi:MAG: TetR/AcrR family transcriptional regulator [Phycisphaeraceae bacterium]|nr:TetR/AcrR family transcriptional regulator [Phycisphaeraceae bacterium]
MARPSQSKQRRDEMLPIIARAFARGGYAATTTADLARSCGLQETQLYRLWPSKKAMFLAVIDHLYDISIHQWRDRLEGIAPGQRVRALLEYDGKQRGSSGLHRITFAGLSESEDPEIRAALIRLHQRFHKYIVELLREDIAANGGTSGGGGAELRRLELAAWGLIGLGSLVNIARELDLFPTRVQKRLMTDIGAQIVGMNGGKGE